MAPKKLLFHALAASLAAFFFVLAGDALVLGVSRLRPIYDVEMWRYAKKLKMRSADPLLGHVHRPGRGARLMGVPVSINAAGFRDREYPAARGRAERLVFLGDSVTFGWGVEKEATFEALIEKRLDAIRPTEILNVSVGNYNTEQETRLFLRDGIKFSPDRVVLFYFINDAEPTARESGFNPTEHSATLSYLWARARTILYGLPGRDYRTYYGSLYAPESGGWPRAQKALLALRTACERRGIGLQVVLLPDLHRLEDYPFRREHRLVTSFLDRSGIEWLDLAEPFSRLDADPHALWVAKDDAHPNAAAHRLIAEFSFDFVAKRKTPQGASPAGPINGESGIRTQDPVLPR